MMQLPPQFFDIFGLATFTYIAFLGFWGLRGRPFRKSEFVILIAIAIAGLAVDGWFVYTFYLQ